MYSNRIARYVQADEERGPTYYVVRTAELYMRVTPQTGRALAHTLRKWLRPRWVRVTDITGSEIWLRSRDIELVAESTPDQREGQRKLTKQLEKEDEDGDAAPAWG
jgi:hypothetical protein